VKTLGIMESRNPTITTITRSSIKVNPLHVNSFKSERLDSVLLLFWADMAYLATCGV
jgi:hypothetical protein